MKFAEFCLKKQKKERKVKTNERLHLLPHFTQSAESYNSTTNPEMG